ncbi:MAG: LPS export ABC transporter periplasmic protein LptC [Chthoniobacterales bacterium]|jgi:lipopolysaccharide export system protein LptC
MQFSLTRTLLLSAVLCGGAHLRAGEPVSGEVEIPVAIGQVLKGMRLPHYDKANPEKLSLRFNADSAERTSEKQFSFQGLRIEIFDQTADKATMEVILSEAVYDRDTQLLTSTKQAWIKGEQFEAVGKQLEFNSKTRSSRLLGPVFMTITQMEEQASR